LKTRRCLCRPDLPRTTAPTTYQHCLLTTATNCFVSERSNAWRGGLRIYTAMQVKYACKQLCRHTLPCLRQRRAATATQSALQDRTASVELLPKRSPVDIDVWDLERVRIQRLQRLSGTHSFVGFRRKRHAEGAFRRLTYTTPLTLSRNAHYCFCVGVQALIALQIYSWVFFLRILQWSPCFGSWGLLSYIYSAHDLTDRVS
jgi:hypothetical protein